MHCFEQVGDNGLSTRAQTHRLSIQFRLALGDEDPNGEEVAETELRAALLSEQLLTERLLSEAIDICRSILPLLGKRGQETLHCQLISKLPSKEAY